MDSDRPHELRDPRDVACEKALLEMIRKDPPGTRYRIDHRRVQMGENPIKITILHVL